MALEASPLAVSAVPKEKAAVASVQAKLGRKYKNISALGQARQLNGDEYHGPVVHGSVNAPIYHGDVNNYLMRQRAAEQVTRTNKALLKAAAAGQLKRVQLHLDKGADPENADESGMTALHYASLGGFEDVVAVLLALNVDVDAASEMYGTPLCLAARKRHYNIVETLLDHGADAEGEGGLLGSPLHAACFAGNNNVAIIKLLVDRGSSPNLRRLVSWDALASMPCQGSTHSSDFATSVLCNPLAVAAKRDSYFVVETLLELGASVNMTCKGVTALMWAAKHASPRVISTLLNRGADTTLRGSSGSTAILYAAEYKQQEAVELLWARCSRHDLINSKSSRSALMVAADAGSVEVVRFLVEHGMSVNARDSSGVTALDLAVYSGHADCVDLLLSFGADTSMTAALLLPRVKSLLVLAAAVGHSACVEVLLRRGILRTTRSSAKAAALHVAAEHGHKDIIKLLVNAGVDVDIRLDGDYTPLMTAAHHNQVKAARKLLELGANAKLKDSEGDLRASDIAALEGHSELGDTLATAAGGSAELSYLFTRGMMKLGGLSVVRKQDLQ